MKLLCKTLSEGNSSLRIPLPLSLFGNYDPAYILCEVDRLCGIAPPLLRITDLPQPKEMTGERLLVKKKKRRGASITCFTLKTFPQKGNVFIFGNKYKKDTIGKSTMSFL